MQNTQTGRDTKPPQNHAAVSFVDSPRLFWGWNSLCISTEPSRYGGHGLVHTASRRKHDMEIDARNVEPKVPIAVRH